MGVMQRECSGAIVAACNSKLTRLKPVAFYTIETTMENHVKIPTIEVKILDQTGYAFIDTAARTSVAGEHLYQILKGNRAQFKEHIVEVSLADRSVSNRKHLTTTADIRVS